jgi:hypothetical protein
MGSTKDIELSEGGQYANYWEESLYVDLVLL